MMNRQNGFTIVELLIVIVIIAILAAITVVAYNGIQDRSRTSKIQGDLRNLHQAIQMARTQSNSVLGVVTGNWSTGGACVNKPAGTDLAALPKTDSCWAVYTITLDRISTASGMNVRGIEDPWGRPYVIDENENEVSATSCTRDYIGAYARPLAGWTRLDGTNINISNSAPGC